MKPVRIIGWVWLFLLLIGGSGLLLTASPVIKSIISGIWRPDNSPVALLAPVSSVTSSPPTATAPGSLASPPATSGAPTSSLTPSLPASAQIFYFPVLFKPLQKIEMVFIPAGKFSMGCSPKDTHCHANELPMHTVRLRAYYIDKYEVTNAQYRICVERGGCTPPASNASVLYPSYFIDPLFDDYPVMTVTWYQAADYCAWAGKRLPTEAEWEKAARGTGDARRFPWGDAWPDCSWVNARINNGYCVGDAVKVGSYPHAASPYGVMEMAGNAWEWTADWFDASYYASYPANGWPANPPGPSSGIYKSIRSGAWDIGADGARVSRRVYGLPFDLDTSTGFRCAR